MYNPARANLYAVDIYKCIDTDTPRRNSYSIHSTEDTPVRQSLCVVCVWYISKKREPRNIYQTAHGVNLHLTQAYGLQGSSTVHSELQPQQRHGACKARVPSARGPTRGGLHLHLGPPRRPARMRSQADRPQGAGRPTRSTANMCRERAQSPLALSLSRRVAKAQRHKCRPPHGKSASDFFPAGPSPIWVFLL